MSRDAEEERRAGSALEEGTFAESGGLVLCHAIRARDVPYKG